MDTKPKMNVAKPSCNNSFFEILVKSIDSLPAIKYPEINIKIAFATEPIGDITANMQSLFEK